jgi:hypothetical protein
MKLSRGLENNYQDCQRKEEECQTNVNPEVVGGRFEVDQGRMFKRGDVTLKVTLKVEWQNDADRQNGDDEKVTYDVTLESETFNTFTPC